MAVEGSLDLFSLPEILQMISQQGKTGILTIQGQQDIVAISFLTGRIVAADSLAHTVEEGLAKLLVSEGMLSGAELSRAGVEHHASGGRLLDLLVERRYLTRPQLLGALRLQTVRQLEALLRWQEGDFKFYGGDEVSYEEGFEPISVEDLLLRNLGDFRAPAPAPAAPAPAARVPAARAPAGQAHASPRPVSPSRGAALTATPAATTEPAGPPVPAGGSGRVVPGPGAAAHARGPTATQAKADSGELWLPQVPELPEVAMPPPRPVSAPAGVGPPPPAGSRLGPAVELPATGPPATGVPAGQPATRPPATGVPAGQSATRVPAAGAPGVVQPATGLPVSALPGGAAIPAAAAAPATSAAVLPAAAQASGSELLPWPAAALEPPPAAPPARPRPAGAGMAKPPGPAAAGGAAAA
ncbi:MAG TPA: DUF4388 domain-containing protein, partial [Thermoanaerobaculia bacterium]|nr:DUF4388 domain-containing protein [Thermoanaerobaculia bacterium]